MPWAKDGGTTRKRSARSVFYALINALQARGAATESLIVNISRQGLIYIPAMFVLGAIFHETGLIWAKPVADVLSLLLAAGLYFRISSKAQNSAVLPPQEWR